MWRAGSKADLLVILSTVHHVKIKSLPYAVTKQTSCILAVCLTSRQLMAWWDRGFESVFLHRRVSCEPDFLDPDGPLGFVPLRWVRALAGGEPGSFALSL